MDLANYIIRLTESFGFWGYLIAFLFAFLESLAFVGGFIPGTTAIVLLGFMCFRGYLNLYALMGVTVLGAVLGDSASYWLGTKGTHFFKKGNRFLKASHLELGQKFFEKHGNKSIFLGRFIGIIRPMIPFAAGLSRMNYKVFLFWNVFSGIIWGISHIYIGYFFGGAFHLIEAWSKRVSVLLLILLGLIILFWLLAKSFTPSAMFILRISDKVTDFLIETYPILKFREKFPGTSNFIGMRFSRKIFTGFPLTLIICTAISFLALFVMLADGILDADPVTELDQRVALFLVFFRDAFLIKTFIWISFLGKLEIVLSISTAFIATLLLWNRRKMIWPYLCMFAACEATIWAIREGLNRQRPAGIIPTLIEKTHSFPSEHSALSVLLYGFICYFMVRILLREKPRMSIWMIFMTMLLVVMIGFSRLYLGAHYFSDVIGGYLIGGICLIAGIGFFEWVLQSGRGRTNDFSIARGQRKLMTSFLIIIPFAFLIIYGTLIYRPEMIRGQSSETTKVLAAKISPEEIFSFNKWTEHTKGVTGRQREPISLMIWAKDDQQLKNAFLKAGWKTPDQPSVKNILKMGLRTAEGKPYDSAPVTPVFWLNQSNDFAFEKSTPESIPRMHCVRLWKTNLIDSQGNVLHIGASGRTNTKSKLDVAAERFMLVRDLKQAGLVSYDSTERISEPFTSSRKAFTVQYFTDGFVANIVLR